MKKLTALNDSDSKKRGPEDLRSVPLDGPGKQPGLGPRFTKVASDAGSSRFKKVGTSAKTGVAEETATDVHDQGTGQAKRPEESLSVRESVEKQPDENVNQESDGEVIPWIPYDFRQHTGCDREDCIARLAVASGNLDSDEEWFV
ncbi:hypothetical protein BU24DRAFT_417163 [Aaosphaeria arxii CBS 175.79]|uniref:Uncharacterized protein n=1 Tax=Aaosphaeria arxii CBS 175.79 TaxID=1450172 RepID=A0A6A5Y7I3_9PLEO|nr:uncharacterized protein BU24DRAFT_417163 [Aaosphaeria arxii CBS 175.79]KAF2021522.1 hypothetical protein BU24DRAFT_417163 [Aaosphaeria arxii CBS 175.79]